MAGRQARQADEISCPISFRKSTRKSGANSSRSCGSATAIYVIAGGGPDRARGGGLARLRLVARARRRREAGAAFEAAIELSRQGKHAEAEAAFAKIADRQGPPATARWRGCARPPSSRRPIPRRRSRPTTRSPADTSVGPVLRISPRMRAGCLLVDTAPFAELRQRLEPLDAAGPHLPPYRARIAGACRPGAPATPPAANAGPR